MRRKGRQASVTAGQSQCSTSSHANSPVSEPACRSTLYPSGSIHRNRRAKAAGAAVGAGYGWAMVKGTSKASARCTASSANRLATRSRGRPSVPVGGWQASMQACRCAGGRSVASTASGVLALPLRAAAAWGGLGEGTNEMASASAPAPPAGSHSARRNSSWSACETKTTRGGLRSWDDDAGPSSPRRCSASASTVVGVMMRLMDMGKRILRMQRLIESTSRIYRQVAARPLECRMPGRRQDPPLLPPLPQYPPPRE